MSDILLVIGYQCKTIGSGSLGIAVEQASSRRLDFRQTKNIFLFCIDMTGLVHNISFHIVVSGCCSVGLITKMKDIEVGNCHIHFDYSLMSIKLDQKFDQKINLLNFCF